MEGGLPVQRCGKGLAAAAATLFLHCSPALAQDWVHYAYTDNRDAAFYYDRSSVRNAGGGILRLRTLVEPADSFFGSKPRSWGSSTAVLEIDCEKSQYRALERRVHGGLHGTGRLIDESTTPEPYEPVGPTSVLSDLLALCKYR